MEDYGDYQTDHQTYILCGTFYMYEKLGAVFNSICLPCRFLTECPGMFARQVPKVISFMKCKLACDIRLIKSLAYPNAMPPQRAYVSDFLFPVARALGISSMGGLF